MFPNDPFASREDLASRYEEDGYVVVPGLLSGDAIEPLMTRYANDIVPSNARYFRQNTSHYEANRLNAHGHVRQSFLDIHAYRRHPEFREAALQIYFDDALREVLSAITGAPEHCLMQSMLFDLNAATPPHQDWWYLDSVPAGGLIAAWIALEDIAPEAGRFYVLPGSHRSAMHEPGLAHSAWLDRMRTHVERHADELHAPALRRGDVLLWNSRTIHGSFETVDERFSRKSLTAHYLPADLGFGNLFGAKPWVRYETWNGHRWFANQPEYSLAADVASRVKLAVYDSPVLLKLARRFQRRSISDLR